MQRATLYSRSRARAKPEIAPPKPPQAGSKSKFREALRRHRVALLAAVPGLAALIYIAAQSALAPRPVETTQEHIDAAVAKSLETVPVPSHSTRAYDAVRGSIVRVRAYHDGPDGGEVAGSIGTGVVILDKGVILTNIHVVEGAKRISLTFSEGMESDAVITGTRPEDDLAVLQASTVPDDLQAATLQSTAGLQPGDFVTAVGFPFGIGPSVSSGVVSGLQREYRSPEGQRLLTNLIQFDAAVNPGNSGGPLLNASGEVVGIVTGILNPTQQRVFVGIGFAVPIENAAMAVGVPPF
ncbi:MAG TPA: trypsin-like peptidase domain-containing protein [Burkholderiales bacterium]|nr:trypsin-like peptidase domain-containing protein [Burkholderiales bacterium]